MTKFPMTFELDNCSDCSHVYPILCSDLKSVQTEYYWINIDHLVTLVRLFISKPPYFPNVLELRFTVSLSILCCWRF